MMKRRLAQLLIAILVLGTAGMFIALEDSNANAVDELTIKIGYYGWNPADYVEKAVFSASDLYDMGAITADYTYWDGSKRVAIDSSYGVPLSTILDAAGIDQGSIANLDFWTADSGSGAFTSFTWKQLIGTKRYYFRDLAACFYYDDDGKIVCDEDEAWNGARRVDAMMALEENWTWYEIGTSDASGTDNLGTANRFRLNFGQDSPIERRTFNSAKMVHTIYVMFSGTPELTADETNIDAKVGSSRQLKVTAASVDEALDEKIQNNVVWSSGNPDIVDVDQDGNLTFKKEGTAKIYAGSGGVTKEFTITVGGEEDEQQEAEPDKEKKNDKGNNSGSGNGSGNGDGNGNSDGNTGGNGRNTSVPGTSTNRTASNTTTPEKKESVKVKNKSNTFVLSEEASNKLRLALNRQAAPEQASMSTHQEEMDRDAEQLKVKKDENDIGGVTGLMGGIIAIEGSLFGFIRYRKQRWG